MYVYKCVQRGTVQWSDQHTIGTMRHVLVWAVALLIAHNAANANAADKLQCRDENNLAVDWYVVYKLPRFSHSPEPLIRTGEAYRFMTDQTVNVGWQLSSKSIGAADSILANTLAPLYKNVQINNREILWTLYNDDPPVSASKWTTGHAKGVVMVNDKQGFWLIHSVPKFAPISDDGKFVPFSYPDNGKANGQSFLCVSLGSDQFDTVGRQLAFNEIRTYKSNIPDTLRAKYPLLVRATMNERIKDWPYNIKAVIRSLNSTEFTSFAKARNWDNNLYDQFIAPELGTNLYVQSWVKTGTALGAFCGNKKVYDIKTTNDHSKWATSIEDSRNPAANKYWVCIGDINRTESQRKRGGGALCIEHRELWRSYNQLIHSVATPCP